MIVLLLIAALLPGCSKADATMCRFDVDGPSAARVWNELALDAVRRDFPAPTVHARNLYHLSALTWDVWAVWDPEAQGVFDENSSLSGFPVPAGPADALRADAMSFGAHRLLTHRYERAVGGDLTRVELDAALAEFCDGATPEEVPGGSAAALGLRIAESIIEATLDDGSNEAANYDDFSYASVNPVLVVDTPGAEMIDPVRWQPLSLASFVTQNGIPQPAGSQTFIGPSWGSVTPFAISPDPVDGLPIDPGPPPTPSTDPDAWFAGIVDVISWSAQLDPASSDDADYLRVIAEFWADGPDSETPPGHWNTIANEVGDRLGANERLIGGVGEPVSRLEWDAKLYIALNGANHDAAIAAWGTKRFYDYARPISMIRYAGGLGQSSNPELASYDPLGLPLIEDLVRLETDGTVMIRSWLGTPADPVNLTSGVGWIPAVSWLPYQRPDFVSPAFASYVSGHSAFSRASAEVLTAFTARETFPGGGLSHTVEPGGLRHELGPAATVVLSWDTYRDAADEAGFSRRAGGIHVPADDLVGRDLGAEVGRTAWQHAQTLFD